MKKVYWIIGNNLPELETIDLTADTEEQAMAEAAYYTLLGFDCTIAEVSEYIVKQARRLKQEYYEATKIT